jgi:hypothetical protein
MESLRSFSAHTPLLSVIGELSRFNIFLISFCQEENPYGYVLFTNVHIASTSPGFLSSQPPIRFITVKATVSPDTDGISPVEIEVDIFSEELCLLPIEVLMI